MNANELADELGLTLEELCDSQRETIRYFRKVIHKQQTEIENINAEWVQAAMALGRCVQENHALKAEIEALKKANEELAEYKWMYEGLCK